MEHSEILIELVKAWPEDCKTAGWRIHYLRPSELTHSVTSTGD